MKNYIIALAALVGFSAQGAYRQVLPKLAQLGHSTRSKVTVAALAQIHKTLPVAAIKHSPLIGAANVLNGTTAHHLQQPDNTLYKSFFNKLPNEPVRFTVAPGNIATGLTPAMLGELLKVHSTGDLYKKEFFQSSLYENWFASYKKLQPTKEKKYFKDQVNKLLRLMQAEKDQEKVQELLLSAVYFQGNTQQDLEGFLQEAGVQTDVPLPESKDPELMKQYAETFKSLVLQEQSELLQAQEIREMAGFCAEKALWSFLNIVCFDTENKNLSLSMVPESVQATMLPAFKEFICNYSNPQISNYYKIASADFLKLVHGIQGVRYLRGSVEIPGERCETLKILNHLFGTHAKSFSDFTKLVSTDQRELGVSDLGEKKYGDMIVSSLSNDQKISGKWHFSSGHVYFLFDKKESKNTSVKKLQKLEEQTGTFGKLVKLVPGYVHRIIDWQNDTVDQVSEKLDTYKILKEELTTLSQGLREAKCTLVHTAVEKNRLDLVNFFLNCGLDANCADSNGDRPLLLAIDKNLTKIAHLLVNRGVDINMFDDENYWSIASSLAFRGSYEKIKLCIELGADVNLKNKYGKTALMFACEGPYSGITEEHNKIVEYLLAVGARSNERCDSGKMALTYAIASNNRHAAKLLVKEGAAVNELYDEDYWFPLLNAAFHGEIEQVKLCVELGADVNLKNKYGQTALMYASEGPSSGIKEGHCKVVEYLLAVGANRDEKNTFRKTALDLAREQNNTKIVELLYSHQKANPKPTIMGKIKALFS